MPLVPFYLLFLTAELWQFAGFVRREFRPSNNLAKRVSAAFVGSCIVAFILSSIVLLSSGTVLSLYFIRRSVPVVAQEDAEAIEWIKTNSGPTDVLTCYRDPKYYLYTGCRGTLAFSVPGILALGVRSDVYQGAEVILDIIKEAQPRYLISTSADLVVGERAHSYPDAYRSLLEQRPDIFVPVFKSANGKCVIYRVSGEAE